MRDVFLDLGDELFESRLLDEGVRGENGVDLRRTAGAEKVGGSRGEVDHGGNAPARHQRQHGDGSAVGGRQHDADRPPFERERHQLGAKNRGRLQQPLIGQPAAGRVLDRQPLATVDFCRLDDRFDDGALGRGGAEHQVGHDIVKRGARRRTPLAAFKCRVNFHLHRFEDRHPDLREQPAAHLGMLQAAEHRLFRPVDANRNNHRVRLIGDHRRAVVDFHQAAGNGDAAFRKNHQHCRLLPH